MPKKINFTQEQIEEIVRLYEKDLLGSREIGKLFNVCDGTILSLLKENKIDISSSHRRKLMYGSGKWIPWGKGLTKNTDERLRIIGEKTKERLINGEDGFKKGNQIWKSRSKDNLERVEIKCQHCGNKFKVKNCRKDEAKFCSVECYRKEIPSWNTGLKIENCESLKNMVKKRKATIKKLKSEGKWIISEEWRKNVSKATSMEKNPRWLGGKSFEPYGIGFNQKIKNKIRKRDNQICMVCGIHREKLKRALHVHHIDYNKLNNSPQNFVSLCNKCHMVTNSNRENWTKFLQGKLNKLYGYDYKEELIFEIKPEANQ